MLLKYPWYSRLFTNNASLTAAVELSTCRLTLQLTEFGFSSKVSNVRVFLGERYEEIDTTAASRYKHTLSASVEIRYGVLCSAAASPEQLSGIMKVLRTK